MQPEVRKDFYVYVIFRIDGTPCYVGKGSGYRYRDHFTRAKNPRLAKLIQQHGEILPVVKVRENLTEQEAFETEIAFINALGRGRHGCLVNFSDGGAGLSGFKHTPEECARRKLRARISDAARKASREANLGRPMDDTTKQKLLQFHTGAVRPDEWKAAIGNANRGKIRSPEIRAMVSQQQKGKLPSENNRKAVSIATKARWALWRQNRALENRKQA